LPKDDADPENVRVDDERLRWPIISYSRRRDRDREERFVDLLRGTERELFTTEGDPFVLRVSDDELAPNFEFVAGPVELCRSLCDDLDGFSGDGEHPVARVDISKRAETHNSGNNSIESKSFTGSGCSSSKDFFFSTSMKPRSPL
jgi:hypothetical protein